MAILKKLLMISFVFVFCSKLQSGYVPGNPPSSAKTLYVDDNSIAHGGSFTSENNALNYIKNRLPQEKSHWIKAGNAISGNQRITRYYIYAQ